MINNQGNADGQQMGQVPMFQISAKEFGSKFKSKRGTYPD